MANAPNKLQHRPKEPLVTKAQRDLWEDLNTTIRKNGGWVVSQPDLFPLRFECEVDSQLPDALRQCGHTVRHLGSHERLLPVVETVHEHGSPRKIARHHVAPGVVAVYEIRLPFS